MRYRRCLRLPPLLASAVHPAAPANVVSGRPLLKPPRCRIAMAEPGQQRYAAEYLGKGTASALQPPSANPAALLPAQNACKRGPKRSHRRSPQLALKICAGLETIG